MAASGEDMPSDTVLPHVLGHLDGTACKTFTRTDKRSDQTRFNTGTACCRHAHMAESGKDTPSDVALPYVVDYLDGTACKPFASKTAK